MTEKNGFIKLMRSALTLELLLEHPNAFLVLSLIAHKALIFDTNTVNGLKKGQAIIGNSQIEGMTRKTYRWAIQKLQSLGLITVISNHKGTIATICTTDVFDINIQSQAFDPSPPPPFEGPAKGHPKGHPKGQPNTFVNPSDEVSYDDILDGRGQPQDLPKGAPHNATGATNKKEEELEEVRKKEKIYKKKLPVLAPSADAILLFDFFVESLKNNCPTLKSLPNEKTAVHFDFLLKKGFSSEEVKKVIAFCHSDTFWKDKVLTPKYLAENDKNGVLRCDSLNARSSSQGLNEKHQQIPLGNASKSSIDQPVERKFKSRFTLEG